MTAVVQLESLTKSYAARRAPRGERGAPSAPKQVRGIEDVSLDVRRGEVFGFLGPNGAGKTTTIRTMLDILRPTRGRASIFGLDAREGAREIHARSGYLPGDLGFAERMTVAQQLEHLGNLRGGVPRERIDTLSARFELDLARPVRALSRGNRQKVGIVQAFMHDPELLVLDEPSSGLDPLMQQEFNALVRETRARGATVFLSSHILSEVEALCDRVGIIREGRLVAVEDVAAIRQRALRAVRATFASAPSRSWLDGVAGVSDVTVSARSIECRVQGESGALVRALAATPLLDITIHEPSLEDVFLGFYGKGDSA